MVSVWLHFSQFGLCGGAENQSCTAVRFGSGCAAAGVGRRLREVRPTGHDRQITGTVIRANGEQTPPLSGDTGTSRQTRRRAEAATDSLRGCAGLGRAITGRRLRSGRDLNQILTATPTRSPHCRPLRAPCTPPRRTSGGAKCRTRRSELASMY
jgi:hypothetical protein